MRMPTMPPSTDRQPRRRFSGTKYYWPDYEWSTGNMRLGIESTDGYVCFIDGPYNAETMDRAHWIADAMSAMSRKGHYDVH